MEESARLLKYLQRVTAELHTTRKKLQEANSRANEPIAIVSAACRFPGGIRTPEALWELAREGRETVAEIPSERGWALPEGAVRNGSFLDTPGLFDAGFFGIGPREALAMDPQQRLLLELAWEALERARLDPGSLRGSLTGVFAGVANLDYASLLDDDASEVEGYLMTGSTGSVASGRVAYCLGLEGPAISIDTACSSSLVALHLAVQSLRSGQCNFALAGGATVMPTPTSFIEFTKQGALSRDGRCRAFSDEASGFGLSEGAGLILLERLSDAVSNGHEVLAVIRGSAVNQDGSSNGLTAPNGPAQQRVILAALADAGLSPDQVGAVEAHGTGTKLGDPIEAQALLATYGRGREAKEPLWVGSIKSNIGHTQAASGLAGVIKMVEAIRRGELPASLHLDKPSSHVDWARGAVSLLQTARAWDNGVEPRRAAVSSFGISGTNAHVILEAPPKPSPVSTEPTLADAPVAFPVSGVDEAMLRLQCQDLADHIESDTSLTPKDVAYALTHSRATLARRAVVLGHRREALIKGLRAASEGKVARNLVVAPNSARELGGVVFVFPGQGPQWLGMARELMDALPSFDAEIRKCADALAPHVDWPLLDVLRGEPGAPALERPDVVQPALFAMMVSLAKVWREHGVEPSAVVGHSQGEIAAACFAGVLSLEDAARIVGRRSRALLKIAGRGGMLAVASSEAEVAGRIADRGDDLALAVVNSPSSVVVSGKRTALEQLAREYEGDGVRARMVAVDYSSHSPEVEEVRDDLAELLAGVTPNRGQVPICSTVSGQLSDGAEMDADYWYTNLRTTVRFSAATRTLLEAGQEVFLEVSPHPVLAMALEESIESSERSEAFALGTLRRDEGGLDRLHRAFADAYVRGVNVEWPGLPAKNSQRPVMLPTTRFRPVHHWPRISQRRHFRGDTGADRYQVRWQAVDESSVDADARPLRWLLLVPKSAHASAALDGLVSDLDGCDADIVRLDVDTAMSADRFEAAFTDLVKPQLSEGRFDVVVSLMAMDVEALPESSHVPRGLATTLALVRALVALDVRVPLWCLTRGGVAAEERDESVDPRLAQIWGLGRVVALEHPGLWGGLIDLPEQTQDRCMSRLSIAVAGGYGEDQLALRASGVLGRRMEACASQAEAHSEALAPLETGTVLITGGLGALGAHVARALVERGAERLVLVGRRGMQAPGAQSLLQALSKGGANVEIVACDVADASAVKALVQRYADAGHPIRSVIHAAGVGTRGPIAASGWQELSEALAAKVGGADMLDQVFDGGDGLDAFVVFSSGAGVWGAASQGPYAAANAHLDALILRRRARGLPGTAIAWGLWEGEGMGSGEAGSILRRRGMRPMSPKSAIAGLLETIQRNEPPTVIADIDWPRFLAGFDAVRPTRLFEHVSVGGSRFGDGDAKRLEVDPIVERWRRASGPGEARSVVESFVTTHAAAVLGYDDSSSLDPRQAFRDSGFDSLTAVELRNRLVAATGLSLPTTVVFGHPTPLALAAHIDASLRQKFVKDEPTVADTSNGTEGRSSVDEKQPIAIVGMGCRYPGGVADPESLWRLVAEGVDAVSAVPTDRGWDLEELRSSANSCTSPVEGGFCYDAADFDADFFGVAPKEAELMDPQQRLVLETAWASIEDAGIDPQSLRGSRTAVMVGVVSQDYGERLASVPESAGYRITGGSGAVVSGRIAYTLGTEGPALTIDTACSSSLVSIHLACDALRRGEADLALAGGVTIMSTPIPYIEFSRQGGLSSNGRCRAFAEAADGTGWGEGVGLVMLERLSDAVANGRQILAVIRGSAINQDGASNGLTAPNGLAQQRVIRDALEAASLAPDQVDVVEAHGTGTTLGDPIEAGALIDTYGQARSGTEPLWVGTIKSNIGHTQAAAGVAGVIKMVMALRHGQLPATLHVDRPTPHVDWAAGVRLSTDAMPWPSTGRPRRAGVSAFGISGTNAHLIVEEAPARSECADRSMSDADAQGQSKVARAPLPFMVSGYDARALRGQAQRLRAYLDGLQEFDLPVLASSLVRTRAQLGERAVCLASSQAELLAGLDAVVTGERSPGVVVGTAHGRPKLAFLFPGQGSQRRGMGRGLYDTYPVYAEAFDAVCGAFDRELSHSLFDVVFAPPDSPEAALLDRTEYVQPALFATQVALVRMLAHYGIRPDIVLGHSIGELVAVHVAGMLSLADACRLVAVRGRSMQACPSGGVMVAIEASPEELLPLTPTGGGAMSLAAINGPRAVVVSGDESPVLALAAQWQARGRRTKRLDVSHAFHSAHMEGACADVEAVAEELTWAPATIPVISNTTGSRADPSTLSSAQYWGRHLREPVRFADGLGALASAGTTVCLELGVDGALCVQVAAGDGQMLAIPALSCQGPEPDALLAALARLHVHGCPLDWAAIIDGAGARGRGTMPLPTYAFQRRRYWLDVPASVQRRGLALGDSGMRHAILEETVLRPDRSRLLTGQISRAEQPWLSDHVIDGTVVVPGIALLDLVLTAARPTSTPRVDELTFYAPIVLRDDHSLQLQIELGPPTEAGRTVQLHSMVERDSNIAGSETEPSWTLHAAGHLGRSRLVDADSVGFAIPKDAEIISADEMYGRLEARGYGFGPAFKSMRAAWKVGAERYAEMRLPERDEAGAHNYSVHPALLDSAGHVRLESFSHGDGASADGVPILFSVEGVELFQFGASRLCSRVRDAGPSAVAIDLADGDGHAIGRIEKLLIRSIPKARLHPASASLHRLAWSPAPPIPSRPERLAGTVALLNWDATGGRVAMPGNVRVYESISSVVADMEAGSPAPDHVVALCVSATDSHVLKGVVNTATRALELIQAFTSSRLASSSRLTIVTSGAIATNEGESIRDIGGAAVWGLVRSARSEHPGRFALLDLEDMHQLSSLLDGHGNVALFEPGREQLALRSSGPKTPSLVPAELGEVRPCNPERSVLITGAGGGLGRAVARHLVATRGARRLHLLGRRGYSTPGMAKHVADLISQGADVEVHACDVADREALAEVLAKIPEAHPIEMVVHAAGVTEDGIVTELSASRIEAAMGPKLAGALHLHQLTVGLPITDFVVFSSASAAVGQPGQAAYAAANAALDALATQRRAAGLPIRSLAWGPWARADGMVGRLEVSDTDRFRKYGVRMLEDAEALRLFDGARNDKDAVLYPIGIDLVALADAVVRGDEPTILHGLAPESRASTPPRVTAEPLRRRMLKVPDSQREAFVLDAVRTHIARQLGHKEADAVSPTRSLLDLGINSLMAVELRNELGADTELKLSSTLVFEYPTAASLAQFIYEAISASGVNGTTDTIQDDSRELRSPTPLRESPLLALELI